MKNILSFVIFAIIALCAAAEGTQWRDSADVLSITDFEFRYLLAADSEGRVYRVRITNDIYRRLRRSYDADLAVFDSDGNVVPFVVRDSGRPYLAPDKLPPRSLQKTEVPIFPLPAAGEIAASMTGVVISTGKDGQIIEIKGNGSESPNSGGGRFLIDLSKVGAAPDGCQIIGYSLEIPVGGEDNTAAWVDVYASDNLRDWRQIALKEPLIRLKRGDDLVTSGVMDLKSSGQAVYLMLETDGIQELPDTAAVSAVIREPEAGIQQDSESFKGLPDGESRSIVYDTAGAFPASEVNFILETPGIYTASVSSRGDESSEWRYLGEIHLSFMKNGAGESRNAPIQVRWTNDRFWRLTTLDRPLTPPPAMRMYWRSKEVIFVAQGRPPYILALGSYKDSPGLARPDLMKIALGGIEGRDIPEADVENSPLPSSASPADLTESERAGLDKLWMKYVVWAVLVGVALLLSWMAWSLIRKDKTS
ncbi:MAG: DUF3999 domain-containing protein [Synergistaceae bacterium]|nr:DUF3999 domain-containing protein [Synergistaceae bacterium]